MKKNVHHSLYYSKQIERERWQLFSEWTAPYVGQDGLYRLFLKAGELYCAEVLESKKRYERFAEDFINAHMYHDAADARSKNSHALNLGIVRAFLYEHRTYAETIFRKKSIDKSVCFCILQQINYGYADDVEPGKRTQVQIRQRDSFESILNEKTLHLSCECFNKCKLFKEDITIDVAKQLFECKLTYPLHSKSNESIAIFFEGLCKKNLISVYWKKVVEVNKLILSPRKQSHLTTVDLSVALNHVNNQTATSNQKLIMNYVEMIANIMDKGL